MKTFWIMNDFLFFLGGEGSVLLQNANFLLTAIIINFPRKQLVTYNIIFKVKLQVIS